MYHEPIRLFQNGGPIYEKFVHKWGGGRGLVGHLRNRLLVSLIRFTKMLYQKKKTQALIKLKTKESCERKNEH